MTEAAPATAAADGGEEDDMFGTNDDGEADPYSSSDPLPPRLRENDHFLLHFADGRQIFAQALPRWRCTRGLVPCKINKRSYWTEKLIGLPYGTVLEVTKDGLVPLPDGEDLLPCADDVMEVIRSAAEISSGGGNEKDNGSDGVASSQKNGNAAANAATAEVGANDNRNLVDDNTSQKLTFQCVQDLMSKEKLAGSDIVAALISNSSTFGSKTAFSQAKYVKRKQLKYQPRCRIVRITPYTLCSALHLKDAKKVGNLREDTLGQVLSNANVCAGARVIVFDTAVQGIITAACTRRMGGYGTVFGLFAGTGSGQQPSYLDGVVSKMNFSIGERQSLKWVCMGEVFGDYDEKERQTRSLRDPSTGELNDVEKRDRESIVWPAPLQDHTRNYLLNEVKEPKKISEFMAKRCARFTRKLTRHSMLELREMIDECRDKEETLDAGSEKNDADGSKDETKDETMAPAADDEARDGSERDSSAPRQVDSLIIATKYDPTATLLRLLPYLAPSCPFVVYHEFLEPLLETFNTLQNYYAAHDNDASCDKSVEGDGSSNGDGTEEKKAQPMMQRRNIAINLRLSDTWFREYQVLEGRTHPNMNMSQNGGYILMGTKLCPRTGTNELDEDELRKIRERVGGRRKQARGKGGGGSAKRKSSNDDKKSDGGKRAKK